MSTIYVDNLSPNLGSRVLAAGHVVQVVHSNLSSNFTTTSATQTSVFSVSITPTSTSSKILVSVSGMYYKNNTGVTSAGASHWSVRRNGSLLPDVNWTSGTLGHYTVWTGSNGNEHIQPVVGIFLDSPATTSSTTYALYLSSDNNASSHIIYTGAELIVQEIAQ